MSILLVVVIRSVISFFALLVLVRIMGKQQVSQLNFFDYIIGITIGSIAANLSVQVNENTTAVLGGLITWSILAILLAYVSMHSVLLRKIIHGEATVLIEQGKILEDHLRKIRIPIDELISNLRSQGVYNIADVEFALMEPNGKISVQKKSQKQPVTPSDLNIATQYDGLPTDLIVDGKILVDALDSLKLTKAWLMHNLKKKSLTDATKISLAQLDTKGNLYVDLKGDKNYYVISTN